MSITVENFTKKRLLMEDRYEIHTESNTKYGGALRWSIGDGEKVVIDSSKILKEVKQHMQAQSISVKAGDAPPLILHHTDFCSKGGHRLVFTMPEIDGPGAPCLIHEFISVTGGEMGNFRKIWNFIRVNVAHLTELIKV